MHSWHEALFCTMCIPSYICSDLWTPRLPGRMPKQGIEQVSEATKYFLESCHIKKKALYSSLGHSSIPVQYSSPVFQSSIPVQYSCPVFLSSIPVQYSSPVLQSSIPVQYSCPVFLSRRPFVRLREQSSTCSSSWCRIQEELSLPFVLAQHSARQFSLHCRHSHASVVSHPTPRLRESGAAPYSDANSLVW